MRFSLFLLFLLASLSFERLRAEWRCGETLSSIAYDIGILRYLVKNDSWWGTLNLKASAKETVDLILKEEKERADSSKPSTAKEVQLKFIAYEDSNAEIHYIFWDIDARFRPLFGDGFLSDGHLHHPVVEKIMGWRIPEAKILFGSGLNIKLELKNENQYEVSGIGVFPRSGHMHAREVAEEKHLQTLIDALRSSGLYFSDKAEINVGWMKIYGAVQPSSRQDPFIKKIASFVRAPIISVK